MGGAKKKKGTGKRRAKHANQGQPAAEPQPQPQPEQEAPPKKMRVTLLSGFLGAGKTTLLKRILRQNNNGDKLKMAVIVNDMGEINLDADEIKESKLIQEDAEMVELHNGCICCTLRGDLLKTVKSLSDEGTFDYLVIESTGISEPLPVAQTFVMDIDAPADAKVLPMDMLTGEDAVAVRQQLEQRQQELDAAAAAAVETTAGDDEAAADDGTIEFEVEGYGVRLTQPNADSPQGTVEVAGEPDAETMNRIFQWISRNIKRLVAEHQRKLTEPKSVPRIPDQKVKLTVAESELNSLSHFATLDTLVTVVDALNIYDVLGSIETLADKDNLAGMVGNTGAVQKVYLSAQPTTEPDVPEEAQQQPQQQPGHEGHEHDQPQAGDAAPAVVDDRSLSQLMLDQIEFADVIVVSKASIFLGQRSEQELDSVRALLSRLNPKARVLVPLVDQYGDMDVARELLNTGLFDMEAAQQSAGWQLELANADHVPETEEYGISSTVFRAHDMPFHPGRLKSILNGFGNYSTATALSAESSSSGSEGVAAEEVFHGVVRAKGSLWLANAHAYPINFHAAGRQVSLEAGGMPFRVTMCDPATHRNQVAAGKWRPKFGDRGSVVVFIGVHLNRRLIAEKLREALLTEAESAALGGVRGWRGLADPFMGGSCADRFFDVPEHLRTMSATAEEASFHDEIADMIAARIAEGAAVDMVVADMNSLRVSHDADVVVDLIPAVVPVLLDAATPSDSEKEYTKALSEVIKRWSGVLTACLRDEQDQLALLGTVFEWLTSKEDERRLQQARFTLMVLYQADIVEEDVLLRWAAELREDEAADPDVASVLAQCNKFFTWLQEADTESSGADDGAGGDSKPS